MRLTLFRWRIPMVSLPPMVAPRARRSWRGSRSAIVVGFIAFAAAQVGLGWAIDTERNPLRDPIYFDKLVQLRRHPAFFASNHGPDQPTTVLFVGSSRTLNAVDARTAGSLLTQTLDRPVEVFNFGQAGAGPITNAVYLRRLLKAGVKPDFAVIEIHPTFLAGQRSDPPETRWLLPVRLRPEELPIVRAMGFPAADPSVHGPRGYFASWYESRYLIVDRYAPFFLMNNQRLNGGHESDEFGFTRLMNWIGPESKAHCLNLAHDQYAYYLQGYRPTGCGIGGLRDSLEVCRAAGIRPALVFMPESSEWRNWYDPVGFRELGEVIAKLGDEYGAPVFDGRTWIADDLILDGHHLMGLGADAFTARLVRESLVPWLKR